MGNDYFGSRREIDSYYLRRREQSEWSRRQASYESSQIHRRLDFERLDTEIKRRKTSAVTNLNYSTNAASSAVAVRQSSWSVTQTERGKTLHEQAARHFHVGDYRQAMASAEQALRSGRKSADLFLLLGVCYLELGRTGAAIDILNRAVKSDKTNAVAFFARGISLDAKNRTADACDDYLVAAKLAPSNVAYRSSAAYALMDRRRFAEAIVEHTYVLERKPAGASSYSARGYCYEETGQYAAAFQDYDKAVSISPSDWRHFFDRGRMHLEMNRAGEAGRDFDVVVRLAPDRSLGYRRRGLSRFSQGDYSSARSDFAKALEIEPEDAETRLAMADCLAKLGEFGDAMKNLKQSQALFMRSGDDEGAEFVSGRIKHLLSAR